MKNLSPEEENIIKDIRNLSRIKKELNYPAIKDTRIFSDEKKKLKQLKAEELKKKIIINQ